MCLMVQRDYYCVFVCAGSTLRNSTCCINMTIDPAREQWKTLTNVLCLGQRAWGTHACTERSKCGLTQNKSTTFLSLLYCCTYSVYVNNHMYFNTQGLGTWCSLWGCFFLFSMSCPEWLLWFNMLINPTGMLGVIYWALVNISLIKEPLHTFNVLQKGSFSACDYIL